MSWCFADAAAADRARKGGRFIKRFDPRFWTVDFPRPMMAAVTTTAFDALRVDLVFQKADDLAGLIWEAEDRWDHPLASYETSRDFRGCTLAFRWTSDGLMPLDAINGPTLTIEGRDAAGAARSWYVRLWNYATGTPADATVTLDFDAMDGGFLLPGEADPVWAGDIDRLFVSLVPPGYTGAATPFAAPVEASVRIEELRCTGRASVLAIGDALVPAHGMRIATGYDDAYNQTPARVLRTIRNLGYRGPINHYLGMSHYFRLAHDPGSGAYLVSRADGTLNAAALAWHRDLLTRAGEAGHSVILSLSYELLDQHCFGDWKQRDADGAAALTGWVPPSTLLSPAHGGAMSFLQAVAAELARLQGAAGLAVRIQIGEPWWWLQPGTGRLCLYDPATRAALGTALVPIADVRGTLEPDQLAALDAAGALLAASTAAIAAAVRAEAAGAELLLLVYLPTVLDPAAPALQRANVPPGWAAPAFDRLQLEDYDWASAGNLGATERGTAALIARLGYPLERQHYFAGFVLNHADAGEWRAIADAAEAARARGVADCFYWALPQVCRDGFTHFDLGDETVQSFDDVAFPLAIGARASVAPEFSTSIATSAGGQESRNAAWMDARMRYDVGPGIRSDADVAALLAFFRARRGPARGFRLADPLDASSAPFGVGVAATDQPLGIGDGVTTRFALAKVYGDGDGQLRRITRPTAGSVRVAVDGTEQADGWSLAPGGIVAFDLPPAAGATLTAGFAFDVPVRFAEDRLELSLAGFRAGEAAAVPLVELREDAA